MGERALPEHVFASGRTGVINVYWARMFGGANREAQALYLSQGFGDFGRLARCFRELGGQV